LPPRRRHADVKTFVWMRQLTTKRQAGLETLSTSSGLSKLCNRGSVDVRLLTIMPDAEFIAALPPSAWMCFRTSHIRPALQWKLLSFRETFLKRRKIRLVTPSLDRGNPLAFLPSIARSTLTVTSASSTRCEAVGCIGLSLTLNSHRVVSGRQPVGGSSYGNAYMHRLSAKLMN
jgi:hypothetical protein